MVVVGLRQFTVRAGNAAGEPLLDTDNSEELVHVQPSISVAFELEIFPRNPLALSTSSPLIWLSDVDRAKGYAVDFLSLSLHAISRDPEAYPSPCIYTQIESADESEDSDLEVLDLSKVKEMMLIPSDASHYTLFQMFCECAELDPEPSEAEFHHSKGEEDGHNWVFRWKMNPELQIDDQRFEDAEEMEQVSDSSHHQ